MRRGYLYFRGGVDSTAWSTCNFGMPILAVLICGILYACGPPFENVLVGSDGQQIRLTTIGQIVNNADLTEEDRRQALLDLGIDEGLVEFLLWTSITNPKPSEALPEETTPEEPTPEEEELPPIEASAIFGEIETPGTTALTVRNEYPDTITVNVDGLQLGEVAANSEGNFLINTGVLSVQACNDLADCVSAILDAQTGITYVYRVFAGT